jgi:hypothetical protein
MTLRSMILASGLFALATLSHTGAVAQDQPAPASGTGQAADHRLFLRYVEDAAVVPSFWLEGQFGLTTNSSGVDSSTRGAGEANLLRLGGVFAFNVAEDFEFGGRIFWLERDPDNGSSDTGLGDMDLWGKIKVATDPVDLTFGLLLSLPTGDEDEFLGTGETNVEFFGGVRQDLSSFSWTAHGAVRINQDPDFPNVSVEGNTSILLGGGAIFPLGKHWALTAETAFETERFEGTDNSWQAGGGFDWRWGEAFMVRAAAFAGLTDGAPDLEAIGSFVWIF